MTRYRRRRLEREESAVALATSVALGAGVALLSFWAVRLFLAREPLDGGESGPAAFEGDAPERLSGRNRAPALPVGGRDRGR